MSWHDPERTLESGEDASLREELRALLGVRPRSDFELEPTPELILLADDLRREAQRRGRIRRQDRSWMLLAAALPFALVLGGVSAWGVSQKHKADTYAAAVQEKDAQLARLAATVAPAAAPRSAAPAPAPATVQLASHTPKARPKGMELVIPVERPPQPLLNDTQRVKGQ